MQDGRKDQFRLAVASTGGHYFHESCLVHWPADSARTTVINVSEKRSDSVCLRVGGCRALMHPRLKVNRNCPLCRRDLVLASTPRHHAFPSVPPAPSPRNHKVLRLAALPISCHKTNDLHLELNPEHTSLINPILQYPMESYSQSKFPKNHARSCRDVRVQQCPRG